MKAVRDGYSQQVVDASERFGIIWSSLRRGEEVVGGIPSTTQGEEAASLGRQTACMMTLMIVLCRIAPISGKSWHYQDRVPVAGKLYARRRYQ